MIAEDVIERLNYVKVRDRKLDLGRFPDFLIVGPQRTGTTWMHANLREHPEVFLSEPKELFFFSRIKNPDHPGYQSDELDWYLRFFCDPPWLLASKYGFFLYRHQRLYRPKVRGEATASYAAVDPDVIEDIVTLNPDVKVILTVRDPVARAWSHATKDLVRNRGRELAEVDDEAFQDFFRDSYQLRCADYRTLIENWSGRVKDGHLLVSTFDEIRDRPEQLLLDVMAFLGISSDPRYLRRAAGEVVNPAGSGGIPDRHRAFLEDLLSEQVAYWKERFGPSGQG